MTIVSGITKHTIVLCVDKPERAISMEQLLKQTGFKVVIANSMYDAQKFIPQEMPHLVISDALLSEGTAGNIYDKLNAHSTLKKTPILVLVQKKTKEELQPLAGRKFAGFLLGPFNPQAFLVKVKEILASHNNVSPHFTFIKDLAVSEDFQISLPATVLGVSNEQVVCKSSGEVDPAAVLVCVPTNNKLGPVMLKMGTNLKNGEEVFNLFPTSRVKGKGRKWIEELPQIDMNKGSAATKQEGSGPAKKVLFYEPNQPRFQQFKDVLSGYGIELIHASSLNMAGSMLKQQKDNIRCVYLFEMPSDASSIGWKEAYNSIPASQRPPVIVGTSSLNAKSTAETRYIKRPFGLGVLVEMIEAACQRGQDLAQATEKRVDGSAIPVSYQAPAKLLGLDETGGVIQLRFPIPKGTKMTLVHPLLDEAWGSDKREVLISDGSVFPDKPDLWQVRFESVPAGTSKSKYWEKVALFLDAKKAAAPAQPANIEPVKEAEAADTAPADQQPRSEVA